MSDLAVVPDSTYANPGTTPVLEVGFLSPTGDEIQAGRAVYKDSIDGYIYALTSAVAASSIVYVGISACRSLARQPISFYRGGTEIVFGVTSAKGERRVASDNEGMLAQESDLGTGDHRIDLGYFKSTSVFLFDPIVTGVIMP